ncbi:MAG: phosphate ABC transporter permease PstA [Syntrophorhabdaceae bacterium]|nr:phosphate ABC transporter permease PstA [Syntrophorhabdaceae bacterium]
MEGFLWICGAIGLLLPLSIFGYICFEGVNHLSISFITEYPKGTPLGTSGGIMPAILGSFFLALIGFILSFPFALFGGIYLSEYGRETKFAHVVRFFVECLTAVPAIIYGLFGYAFLVVFLKFGVSLIAGSITLSLIMFPIMLISIQEALLSIKDEYREAAFALGVSKIYIIRRVLIPRAWPSIVAGIVLAVGHAIGSASPVLFTASIYFSKGNVSLDQPVMTLPTHLYYIVSEAISMDHGYGTAIVLILGLLIFNLCAMFLRKVGSLKQ